MANNRYEALKGLYSAQGGLAYSLAVFGDHIAEREGYKEHQDIDAIHFSRSQVRLDSFAGSGDVV